MAEKNIALLPNPTRQTALQKATEIAALLDGKNIRYQIFSGIWPADFSGFSEVWLVGGDGTLNFFINHYPDIQLPLAIFRGGTGNDFHFALYGNITLPQQVDNMLRGKTKAVDAGRCNEKLFLNNLGIGFDARITRDLMQKQKRPGKASYYLSVWRHIFFFRSFTGRLQWPGGRLQDKFFMISVMNGQRTGGGFYLAPQALLDDGKLNVNVVTKLHPFSRICYLPLIEKGKHVHRSLTFLNIYATDVLSFQAEEILHAHADGEYFQDDRFTIRCLAAKFIFLV